MAVKSRPPVGVSFHLSPRQAKFVGGISMFVASILNYVGLCWPPAQPSLSIAIADSQADLGRVVSRNWVPQKSGMVKYVKSTTKRTDSGDCGVE